MEVEGAIAARHSTQAARTESTPALVARSTRATGHPRVGQVTGMGQPRLVRTCTCARARTFVRWSRVPGSRFLRLAAMLAVLALTLTPAAVAAAHPPKAKAPK